MKRQLQAMIAVVLTVLSTQVIAQDGRVKTIFRGNLQSSGGYAALTNKFTTIRGDYTNLAGLYGGWYINHRVMVGVGAAASTNNLRVPQQFSTDPNQSRTWQYGQFGLVTEYVMNSDKPIHLAFHMFGGAGFTLQYQRDDWDHNSHNNTSDENWFVVAEPGVQLEINLFKWMRLSPGVSYRATFGSDGRGLDDSDLRGVSYNATVKFGKF
ncbi:MAG: hypothetical protein H7122_01125 [Chitinophagaceae bacterium]|nr:hypothetical protein [Chitinophagaceae bacterium]